MLITEVMKMMISIAMQFIWKMMKIDDQNYLIIHISFNCCCTQETIFCLFLELQSNNVPSKVLDESLIHSKTSIVAHWCLGLDKLFHPTLYNECDYLAMLVLKLIQVTVMSHEHHGFSDPQLIQLIAHVNRKDNIKAPHR